MDGKEASARAIFYSGFIILGIIIVIKIAQIFVK